MTTVFLSGSRKISRLNNDIRSRMLNILEQKFLIVVGDANGADKAMQTYLAEQHYPNVLVFCAGDVCRNNIGSWDIRKVEVDKKLTGRAFYTQKDNAMVAEADYGFVLWDGKSEGSINNVLSLINAGKKAVVYLSPRKKFFSIKSANDVQSLLNTCDPEAAYKLRDSKSIRRQMENLNITRQGALHI